MLSIVVLLRSAVLFGASKPWSSPPLDLIENACRIEKGTKSSTARRITVTVVCFSIVDRESEIEWPSFGGFGTERV